MKPSTNRGFQDAKKGTLDNSIRYLRKGASGVAGTIPKQNKNGETRPIRKWNKWRNWKQVNKAQQEYMRDYHSRLWLLRKA